MASLLRNRNLMLLGAASLLTDISSEMVYPFLGVYFVGALGGSKSVLGLLEGVAEAVAQVFRVFAGAWSDRLGRRKELAAGGYGLSAVGKALLWLASGAAGRWLFFAGRIADRFGKAVRSPPRDALIAQSVDRAQVGAAFGLHRAMDTAGALLGVAIAYVVTRWGGESLRPLFLWAILPAVLGVVALLLVREARAEGAPAAPPVTPSRPGVGAGWRAMPAKLRAYLMVAVLFAVGNSSNQFLLLRSADVGLSASNVVLMYGLYNLVYVVASYPCGALSDRVGRRPVLCAGFALYGLVYLGFALVGGVGAGGAIVALGALWSVYGVHMALTEGVEKALVTDLAPPHLRATILGLFSTVVGLTLLPASLIAGLLWDHAGAAMPFWLGAATGLGAAGGAWWALREPASALPGARS